MKKLFVVAMVVIFTFVVVAPAFAGCPNCGGRQGGGGQQSGFGQAAIRYGQRSAQGWGQAAQGTVVIAREVGNQVAKDAQKVAQAAKKLNQATVNAGDSAHIAGAIQNTTNRAQGR
jgi:hypothetical protein